MVDFANKTGRFDALDQSPARPPFLNNRLINFDALRAQRYDDRAARDVYNAVEVLALLLFAAALATTDQSADQQTGASRVALASVTDPRNRPLVDVGPDDFVIQEAGTPRDILSVRPADYPI